MTRRRVYRLAIDAMLNAIKPIAFDASLLDRGLASGTPFYNASKKRRELLAAISFLKEAMIAEQLSFLSGPDLTVAEDKPSDHLQRVHRRSGPGAL